MMSSNVLQITQGSDWAEDFTWLDADNNPRPEAIGSTIRACLMEKLTHKHVLDFTVGWTDESLAQGVIQLDNTETPNVPLGCVTEVKFFVTLGGGEIEAIVGGFDDIEGLVGCP